MQNRNDDSSGREQSTSLVVDTPVDLVWEAWTTPEHIRHWWGPAGFTNTIEKMQVEAGGEWIFILHRSGGKRDPDKTIFREVIR